MITDREKRLIKEVTGANRGLNAAEREALLMEAIEFISRLNYALEYVAPTDHEPSVKLLKKSRAWLEANEPVPTVK